eukprot:UC1_evm3s523
MALASTSSPLSPHYRRCTCVATGTKGYETAHNSSGGGCDRDGLATSVSNAGSSTLMALSSSVSACASASTLLDSTAVSTADLSNMFTKHENFFTAVVLDDAVTCSAILQQYDSETVACLVCEPDSEGCCSCLLACRHGALNVIKLLVDFYNYDLFNCADTDANRGGRALHYACWGGQRDVMLWLQERGADLNQIDLVGNTPLLYAIYGGHLDLVQELVEVYGCSLKEVNNKGHSAIIQAACGGHREVVEWLLANGSALSERDYMGNTPLLFAAWGGHLDLVDWLLQNGSNINEMSNTGHTALLSAANSGALNVVQWLHQSQGVSLDERNQNGDTALLLAAFGGHCNLLSWLIANGCKLEDCTNNDGLDALLSACNGGNLPMVRYLISLGLSLDHCNESGYGPLILAACGDHMPLVRWLHEQGCDLNKRTADGDTAFLLACYCGHVKLVEWFLTQQCCSVQQCNNAGLTPLISAANGGHPGVIQTLLHHGAMIDERDNNGYSALLLAARRGHLPTVQWLAVHGADLSARTKFDLDAIALANGNDSLQEWLRGVRDFTPLHIAIAISSPYHVMRLLHEGAHPLCLTSRNSAPTPLQLVEAQAGAAGCSVGLLEQLNCASRLDIGILSIESPITACLHLLRHAARRWSPLTHHLFGPMYRHNVVHALMLSRCLPVKRPDLPVLPLEVWYRIISLVSRDIDSSTTESEEDGGALTWLHAATATVEVPVVPYGTAV